MSFVDKKCWQILGKLRSLPRMSEGAIRYFCAAVLGMAPALIAADEPGTPPFLPGTDPAVNNATNVAPVVIAPTNSPAGGALPIVEGGTNIVLTAEERKNAEFEKARQEADAAYEGKLADAEKKWEAATNSLGVYHLIPERNPFKLIKQEIEKPPVRIVATTTVGVPHLAGISMLRNNMRAVLRINPIGGGPATYEFLEVGQSLNGVDVLKIDPKEGIVEVKVRNKTHSLELDKITLTSSKSPVRPSGSSYRPGSSSSRSSGTPPRGNSPRGGFSKGGSSSGKRQYSEAEKAAYRKKIEEAKKSGGSRTSPQRPPGSGGNSLRSVPKRSPRPQGRGRNQSNLDTVRPIGSDLYELPAFNEVVQKQIIDPLNISTQREIIRGQLSYETPTDLPGHRR